jgi:hypothetical protein
MKLRYKETWSGKYRGVIVEVCRWSYGAVPPGLPKNCWNYYLYLDLSLFQDKALAESLWLPAQKWQITETSPIRWTHDYYSNPFLSGLEMHGGITYYQQHQQGEFRQIQVGCDFQHYGDETYEWNLDSVLADCKACIDAMLKETVYNATESSSTTV